MAAGDITQILELPLTPDGKIDVTTLNGILRQMQERFFALEGRTQASQIRNDLTVLGEVVAESLETGSISLPPAGSAAVDEVSVDGSLLSDPLGVLPYGLHFLDNLGVEKDLLYPSPFSAVVRDEFFGRGTASGAIGDLGWELTGGATATPSAGVSGHLGVVQLDSGAGPIVTPLFLSSVRPADVRYLACVLERDTSTNPDNAIRFGLLLSPGATGNTSRGMYFYFDDAVGSEWHTVTRNATGFVDTATTVEATVGRYQLLEIVLTPTTVDFYINRRRTNRHTTNLELVASSPTIAIEAVVASTILNVDTFCLVGALGTVAKWE